MPLLGVRAAASAALRSTASRPSALVICGPSGVGKSVLIRNLRSTFPDRFSFLVSHTTRRPRPGEQNGVSYHFVSAEKMKTAIAAGEFIESACVHGNLYGVSKAGVDAVSQAGKICIFDVDRRGATNISECRYFENLRFLFLLPPSMEELERRLRGRGTETEGKILQRLATARDEIDWSERADIFDRRMIIEDFTKDRQARWFMQLCDLVRSWYPSLSK
eukprot:TRINITY_DN74617_c0_g1_i1.p1 TRINITY_DN74617_c0_g1~~TRINITY_DN74617_c0_g1_i1.p1  ORF type:complete len:219 (+),score=27.36 TRINITY_DN74617_c0_g1_i1:43-699(+)